MIILPALAGCGSSRGDAPGPVADKNATASAPAVTVSSLPTKTITSITSDYLTSLPLSGAKVCITGDISRAQTCVVTDKAGSARVPRMLESAEITVAADGYLPFNLLVGSGTEAFAFRPILFKEDFVAVHAGDTGIEYDASKGLLVTQFSSFHGAIPPVVVDKALAGAALAGVSFSARSTPTKSTYLGTDLNFHGDLTATTTVGIGLAALPPGDYALARDGLPAGATCEHVGGATLGLDPAIRLRPATVTAVWTRCVTR